MGNWNRKRQELRKHRLRNILLNAVCVLLAGSGLWATADYFWRHVNYVVTNDAFVDQYVAPLSIRVREYFPKDRLWIRKSWTERNKNWTDWRMTQIRRVWKQENEKNARKHYGIRSRGRHKSFYMRRNGKS